MAEGGQEPPAARPVRVCRICVDFLQSPAAVEPCGHVFCHACIQPQAAPEAAATCPVCQGPIRAIRLLPGQDTEPGPALGAAGAAPGVAGVGHSPVGTGHGAPPGPAEWPERFGGA